MAKRSTRALRWAAPIALVGALGIAACGDDDDNTQVAAPRPAAVTDNHLDIRAAEIREEQGAQRAASDRLAAQAEHYERQAHLEGQAETHGNSDDGSVPTNSDADIPDGNPYGDEFLPGSRHVPAR
jgi:hypothetical protein